MKHKVLIVEPIDASGMAVFDDRFEVRVASDPSAKTVMREMAGVEGVIVRNSPFPREIIEAADSLRVISRHGVGLDHVDLAAATERGIYVLITADANALSVAEHTIIAMGALAKRVLPLDRATRQGGWEARNENRAVDLEGKVLGLVGLGRIGSLVARKARGAFNDMKVIGYARHISAAAARAMGVTLVDSVDEVFRQADVVSLGTPLTPETRGLVSAERLALMKPSAFLINFARGPVVDEDALYDALVRGVIAGAALDVYHQEPPRPDHSLYTLDNVLLSPHSAALTRECVARMATGAAQGVVDVLTGQTPRWIGNPEVLEKHG